MGQTVNSLLPLNISWTPSCLSSSDVDIYLYAPKALGNSRIHLWQGIPTAQGSYAANLMPRWWNSTASESLQILIAEANVAPFLASYTSGPMITATYTAPSGTSVPAAADTSIVDSGITTVDDLSTTTKGLSPGKTAAAVLMPLLVVLLAIGVYLKFQRTKGREKRKRWSEAVDKRMSTISTDWKSVTPAGASAAIRNSMAVSNRNSAFSFGGIRPGSMAIDSSDGGQAGVGALSMAQRPGLRTGVGLRNPGTTSIANTDRVSRVSFAADTRTSRVSFAADTRTSRVSFANDPRPSGESRRTRAFHSAYIPPVPSLPTGIQGSANQDDGSDDHSDAESPAMSPTQTAGPLTLTPEDIRARISGGHARAAAAETERERQSESEMDEVMPALSSKWFFTQPPITFN